MTEFNGQPAVNKPCIECPWRRDSAPGWLGPYNSQEWTDLAMSDEPVACHRTIKEDGNWHGAKQCAGIAQFRKNVCKLPADNKIALADKADYDLVFGNRVQFMEYHEIR